MMDSGYAFTKQAHEQGDLPEWLIPKIPEIPPEIPDLEEISGSLLF